MSINSYKPEDTVYYLLDIVQWLWLSKKVELCAKENECVACNRAICLLMADYTVPPKEHVYTFAASLLHFCSPSQLRLLKGAIDASLC